MTRRSRALTLLSHVFDFDEHCPGYKLTEAQAKIIETYGDDVVRYRITFAEYANVYRNCKLFDYDRKQWTDFRGRPTAAPIDLDAQVR